MSDFKLLINGRLVEGDSDMDVINPATEEPVARCARASKAQLDQAVAAAKAAFPAWAATPIDERRKALVAMADVIQANIADLARLLTQEQGKPLEGRHGRGVRRLGLLPLFRQPRPARPRSSRTPPRRRWRSAGSRWG
jgi:acyl-CoA reductase-like NAD-dependent aldehyde dehydrogenase